MITLRNYQQECLEAIKQHADKGIYRQLISMGTGGGKTVVFANLIKTLNCRALIIAHTQELLKQAAEKMKMIAPEIKVGFVNEHHKDFNAQVVISSIQSACIESNLKQLIKQNFPLLIYDESHRAASDGARRVIDVLGFGKNTKKLLCGFTATGWREDGKGLGEVFDTVAYEISAKELIDQGYLVPPVGFKITTDIDLSQVKTVEGDYCSTTLERIFNTKVMNDLVIKTYKEKALGRPTICFGASVKHAKNLSDGFIASGISSEVIDGSTPEEKREAIFDRYNTGKTTVLCNAMLLTEGVDLPHTSCIIMARGTKSRLLYQQCIGRGIRPWPFKDDCVVIDFSDRNHTLCGVAVLLDDAEVQLDIHKRLPKKKPSLSNLPANLNPQLKAALVNHDPLSKAFTWGKNEEKNYVMRGSGSARIEIQRQYDNDKYCVMFYDNQGNKKKLAQDLSFEWAFSTAEDFARANRKLFVISDRDAEWRKNPITDKQKALFKRCRYKAAIDQLSCGQAADIIDSGVLFKGKR